MPFEEAYRPGISMTRMRDFAHRILERIRSLLTVRRHGNQAASAWASVIALVYLFAILRQGRRPEALYNHTAHNIRLLKALADILDHPYYPSWLTPNTHINCFLGFAKRGPRLTKTREMVRTPDGGTFAMDWRNREEHDLDLAADAPTLFIIHGLNGHSDEGCVLYAMENAYTRGWRAVAMNHRGCGGTSLTSGWSYNGAFTGDVRLAVEHIRRRYPNSPIFAVGYSLGANLLIKYLGEEGMKGKKPLAGAVSVSNPWNFEKNTVGGEGRARGLVDALLGRFYSMALTIGVKMAMKEHVDNEFIQRRRELDLLGGMRACNLAEYDSAVIVPMWGYKDVEEYQHDASSGRYLQYVECPVLCINADDDPICQPGLFPLDVVRMNSNIVFVRTRAGGHIGFGEGFNPWGRESWADRLITRYLDVSFAELSRERMEEDAEAFCDREDARTSRL